MYCINKQFVKKKTPIRFIFGNMQKVTTKCEWIIYIISYGCIQLVFRVKDLNNNKIQCFFLMMITIDNKIDMHIEKKYCIDIHICRKSVDWVLLLIN